MWSESWMNHSTRSLPWNTGRINSSVVGHARLALQTPVTEGFHVTSERERYLKRLNALSSPSKPGSACTSGSSWETSAKWRLTGYFSSSRSGESPATPGIRCVFRRVRSIAAKLLPFFGPNTDVLVSSGAANGSNPALTQSARIALNVAMITGSSNVST